MDPLANKYIQIETRSKNAQPGSNNNGIASAATVSVGPQYKQQQQQQYPQQQYETGSGPGGFQNVLKQLSDQRSKIDEILIKSRNYQANKMRLSLDDDDGDGDGDAPSADEDANNHSFNNKFDDKQEYAGGRGGNMYNINQHHVPTPKAHHPTSQTVDDLRKKISELKNQSKPDPKAPRLRSNQTMPHRNKSIHNSSNKGLDVGQNLSHRSIHQFEGNEDEADPEQDKRQAISKRRSVSTHQPDGFSLPPISNSHGGEGSVMRNNQRTPSQSQLLDRNNGGRNSSLNRRSPSVYSQKQLQWLRSVQNERSKAIQRIYVQQNPQGQVRKFNQQEQQFRDSFMNEMNTKINANRMVAMTQKSKSKKKRSTQGAGGGSKSANPRTNSQQQQQQQQYQNPGMYSQDDLLNQLYANGGNVFDLAQPSYGANGLNEFSYYNQEGIQGSREAAGLVKVQPNPLNFIAYQSDFESLIERQSEETMEILDYVFESSKNKPKSELLEKLNEFKANFTLHAEKQDKQLREIKKQHRYFQTFDVPRDYLNLEE